MRSWPLWLAAAGNALVACGEPDVPVPVDSRETQTVGDTGVATLTTGTIPPEFIEVWADDAEPWTPIDIRVSDLGADIHDPEFDLEGHHMVWSDAPGAEMWVTPYDPATGLLSQSDGRAVLVDTLIQPYPVLLNGPEWVQTDRGGEVVYGKATDGVFQLWRAHLSAGEWTPELVDGVPDRVGTIGSLEPGDPDARLLYYDIAGQQLGWQHIDGRSGGPMSDLGDHGPRWVLGGRGIVWSEDVGGTQQVHLLDPDSSDTVQVTDALVGLESPYMWADAGGAPAGFAATFDNAEGEPVGMDVYQVFEGEWLHTKRIHTPAAFRFAVSPEIWSFDGRVLLFFQASVSDELADTSQIWVAGAASDDPLLRKVSRDGPGKAFDPEWVEVDGRPHVYYTHTLLGTRTLRLADVGE